MTGSGSRRSAQQAGEQLGLSGVVERVQHPEDLVAGVGSVLTGCRCGVAQREQPAEPLPVRRLEEDGAAVLEFAGGVRVAGVAQDLVGDVLVGGFGAGGGDRECAAQQDRLSPAAAGMALVGLCCREVALPERLQPSAGQVAVGELGEIPGAGIGERDSVCKQLVDEGVAPAQLRGTG